MDGVGGISKEMRWSVDIKVVEAVCVCVCVKLWGLGGKVQGSSNRQMEEE